MILKTTTHSTRITSEPGSTYADAPRETTFPLQGRERPMTLDGRLEDSVQERLIQPNVTDVRQLAAVFRNPGVGQAQELLDRGAQSVEVDLGAWGRWQASAAEDRTRFTQGDSETSFSLRGTYVTLEAYLAPERTMQAVVGRYNESSGTITVLSEEVRTTETEMR